MSADRKAAVWIGVLYIIGTVGMVLSGVVTNAVLSGPAYLAQVAAQPNQVAVGALLLLLAGFALALVPVVFWPVGRRYNETLAMGYVVFRGAIEAVIYIVGVVCWLLLIALSKEPDVGPLAGFVRTTETVIWDQLHRHPVRSRRADVLRPALPVAARAPVAVRLGARGGRALHRGAAREHVRALAGLLHGSARPAGDGHGGMADRERLQPRCQSLPSLPDGHQCRGPLRHPYRTAPWRRTALRLARRTARVRVFEGIFFAGSKRPRPTDAALRSRPGSTTWRTRRQGDVRTTHNSSGSSPRLPGSGDGLRQIVRL